MNISLPRVRRIALIALGVAITALMVALYFANRDAAQATHSPANKVWVSASKVEFMHAQIGPATNQEVVTERNEVILAEARGKFSNPTDLRLSVTSECALWTNLATIGDDDAESKARVEVWITIDGKVVPVSLTQEGAPAPNPVVAPGGSVDPDDQAAQQGRVVFCNRATRMKTENIETTTTQLPGNSPVQELGAADSDEEDDILLRSYQRTRQANGFNWAAMNVGQVYDTNYKGNGKGQVLIEVHARLAASLRDEDNTDNETGSSDPSDPTKLDSTDSPLAAAAVGKRTLFVEPVKMANDAVF